MKNIHPPIDDSFAFKFKLGKNVFPGDIACCPDMAIRRPNAAKLVASIKSHHTGAEDVGRIAKAANVKTLILNHFVPPDDKSLTDQIWLDAVKTNYQGNIIIGKDLLQLAI